MRRAVALTPDYFGFLLRYPRAVETVTAALLRHAETATVLAAARETLWQGLLNAPESGVPSTRAERRSVTIQAALVRGFNLALIVAWRPTGDGLADLERLYPGFTSYAIAYADTRVDDLADEDDADDSRAFVQAFEQDAKRLLWRGVRHGYGLGMLISDALDAESAGPGAAIGGPATLHLLGRDDPAQAEVAASWAAQSGAGGLGVAVAGLVGDPDNARLIEAALESVSRQHPIAVPETIERFSDPFVLEMLAFLLRWWADVGLRCQLQSVRDARTLPSAGDARARCRIGRWLSEYTRRWAVAGLDEVRQLMAEPLAFRAGLVQRSRLAVIVGMLVARAIDRAG